MPTVLTRPASLYGDLAAAHVLHPGDVVCAERGDRLETLLGSCVSIILTDPRRTVGAMCHIVHASPARGGWQETTAHAEEALDSMFGLLQDRGINPLMCESYLFGGGNMFPALFKQTHVGESNARWAFDALAEHRIPILAHDTGGTVHRRVAWTVGRAEPQVVARHAQGIIE